MIHRLTSKKFPSPKITEKRIVFSFDSIVPKNYYLKIFLKLIFEFQKIIGVNSSE